MGRSRRILDIVFFLRGPSRAGRWHFPFTRLTGADCYSRISRSLRLRFTRFHFTFTAMTKYWVAATADSERRITVFTETYDAAIDHDLEQAPVGSLIHCVTDATP